jgi:transcription antitermination protein NusB
MSNRRAARESALKAIYAVEVGSSRTQDVTKNIIKAELKDDSNSIKFAEKLLLTTVDFAHEYDEIIQNHIKNWKVERLAMLDKLIIRMAITEFLHFEEVPTKVTINEAIELAKDYSTGKSGNFVNGILDAVLNQLDEDGKINKKGRGLIESS